MDHFELVSQYAPTGDQPQAIEELVKGFQEGNQFQTLLGVTGSGKTFTMANIIQALNKPTLIIAHNKTLAAQLYGEFKEFFPHNAVEYFVSYYDYYQPEAYVPSTDTYIAKDSSINDEIDKLRLSATAALVERKDVIIISSVSCIYGLGSPVDYKNMMLSLRPGMEKDRDEVIRKLIDIQYTRNDMDFQRGTFRVRGDVVEIFPANFGETAIRVEFFGDEVDRITEIDVLTGEIKSQLEHMAVFPASHYVVAPEKIHQAAVEIEKEMEELSDEKDKVLQTIEVLKKRFKAIGSLEPEKLEMLKSGKVRLDEIDGIMDTLTAEYDELGHVLESSSGKGKIVVYDIAYSGVKLTISNVTNYLHSEVHRSTFVREGADIRVRAV